MTARLRARRFRIAAAALLGLGLAGPAAAGGDAGHGGGHGDGKAAVAVEPLPVAARSLPVELVRTLQHLQDQIARGSTQAHLGQRTLIGHIENRLLTQEPAAWTDPANLRAAVTFVLSGGGPTILRQILAGDGVPEAELPLVQGALAYLEGREKEARRLLVPIDARTVPPGLAGQLALIQSALVVRDDPAGSLRFLDLARLLAPGTLVEEGALRRQVFVLAQVGDVRAFEALSIQYLRRFRHSVYAGNFRQRFAAALTRLDFAADRGRFARLEAMLNELDPEGRRDLYLLVARAAIDQGRTAAAISAADRAGALAGADRTVRERARLYRSAAGIVVPGRFDEALAGLRAVDRDALPEADATLLDAAFAAARGIRDLPPPAPAEAPPAAAAAGRELPQAAAIARARSVIQDVDDLMQRSRQ
ncbi:chemotaxis protein MotC [uncultured Methylobacterium sp.]|uniref:chemotaxis protein MotC n=1 Tax=uncultured Methylobacterium sp. TaxID=157278 RepID=UPI0026030FAA|nr:chemotaxis protein MotC [uncultured Methylobacterium sp.]